MVPAWRDAWLWIALLALVPLLMRAWSGSAGTPFADDYDFLHRALLSPQRSLLDGGGAVIYWRPLARQVYFGLAGPLMLSHPRAVALLHVALLALAVVLIHRMLRPRWGGPWAAAAASFPLLAEGTRALVIWPTSFQDLGAVLFSALALHEASRRRLLAALGALLAALLCKEIAVITAFLLPWMPGVLRHRRERIRWAGATCATVATWMVVYGAVMRSAGLMFQRELESGRLPLPHRLLWSLAHGLLDGFSLGALAPALVLSVLAGVLALLVLAFLAGRRRAHVAAPGPGWVLWGLAYFTLATATLSETFPMWGSFRSTPGLLGLGIAATAFVRRAGLPWLALLVAVRVATLFVSPGPPRTITLAPPAEGAGLDFESLARLQRYAAEVRAQLQATHPTLPPGAIVAQHHRPLMSEHAFAHGKALQVWYRDTTLRWVNWKSIVKGTGARPAAVLEYEPRGRRQVTVVGTASAGRLLDALDAMDRADYPAALALLGQADSLQSDREAAVFLATLAGKRALCLFGLDDEDGAWAEAKRSLELWSDVPDARYVTAALLVRKGRYADAIAELDSLLARNPFDKSATILRDTLRAAIRRPPFR